MQRWNPNCVACVRSIFLRTCDRDRRHVADLHHSIVFEPTLLIALWVPSPASAATAKYQVPAARPETG